MKLDETGGPAFPVQSDEYEQGVCYGMSLRDWFAGLAMQSLLRNICNQRKFDSVKWNEEEISDISYDIAESMIEERNNR